MNMGTYKNYNTYVCIIKVNKVGTNKTIDFTDSSEWPNYKLSLTNRLSVILSCLCSIVQIPQKNQYVRTDCLLYARKIRVGTEFLQYFFFFYLEFVGTYISLYTYMYLEYSCTSKFRVTQATISEYRKPIGKNCHHVGKH